MVLDIGIDYGSAQGGEGGDPRPGPMSCPFCRATMAVSVEISNCLHCTNPECVTDLFVMDQSIKVFHTSTEGEVIREVWMLNKES